MHNPAAATRIFTGDFPQVSIGRIRNMMAGIVKNNYAIPRGENSWPTCLLLLPERQAESDIHWQRNWRIGDMTWWFAHQVTGCRQPRKISEALGFQWRKCQRTFQRVKGLTNSGTALKH